MKFDDVITEVGEFGLFQKKIYFLLCPVTIFFAFHVMDGIFILAVPEHRCAIPSLDNDTYESQGHWHDELVRKYIPRHNDTGEYSQCFLYQMANGSGPSINGTASCNRWVYNKEVFLSTFVSEVDLVCDKEILKTYANMIIMSGLLCGSLVMGTLADIIGQRKVLLLSVTAELIAGIVVSLVSSFALFVVLKFFEACFAVGAFLAAYVIGVELVGPSKRRLTGTVIIIFWGLGMIIQTGLAYFVRDWRSLQLTVSVPGAALIVYFWTIPESPRWLFSAGRTEEASRILRQMAKRNGAVVSEQNLSLQNVELEGAGEKVWHMFSTPVLLLRSLIIYLNWFVASFTYFGLSLNVENLSGSIYVNAFLSALVETVGYSTSFFLLDIAGRRPFLSWSNMIGGVACVCCLFPVIYGSSDTQWITTTLSMVGKMGATAGFAGCYVFSSELFPTVMRNSAVGLGSFSARIGGILAPYIADVGNIVGGSLGVALPLLIFGSVSIVAGLLARLLPETLNRKLPDTVENAKNFGKSSYQMSKHSHAMNDKTKLLTGRD